MSTAKEFPGRGYDLVTVFDALHDMGDPVGVAAHVCASLAPSGTWLIVEPYAEELLSSVRILLRRPLSTTAGVWQSVSRTVSEIPVTIRRLGERIAQAQERIVTIDRELARLEDWDGQIAYDATASELSAINTVFAAAAEEQASAEQGKVEAAAAVSSAAAEEALADVLLALSREEQAVEGWDEWETVIPPAPASLAWMSAETDRLALPRPALPELLSSQELDVEPVPLLAGEVGLITPTKARIRFGDPLGQRHPQAQPSQTSHGDVEVRQLPLF